MTKSNFVYSDNVKNELRRIAQLFEDPQGAYKILKNDYVQNPNTNRNYPKFGIKLVRLKNVKDDGPDTFETDDIKSLYDFLEEILIMRYGHNSTERFKLFDFLMGIYKEYIVTADENPYSRPTKPASVTHIDPAMKYEDQIGKCGSTLSPPFGEGYAGPSRMGAEFEIPIQLVWKKVYCSEHKNSEGEVKHLMTEIDSLEDQKISFEREISKLGSIRSDLTYVPKKIDREIDKLFNQIKKIDKKIKKMEKEKEDADAMWYCEECTVITDYE